MKIFLSHADANHDIADALCTLLGDGLNITRDEIFCSSLPGQTIPGGFNFVDYIKKDLEQADVVICILSECYLERQFCMAELGASWILEKKVIPLIVPPLSYECIKATLSLKQAWKIADQDDLNSLADDLKESKKTAQWGVACGKFLKSIEKLIKAQPASEKILFSEYKGVKEQLDYAENELSKKDDEIHKLHKEIEELKKCKDKSDVDKIEKKYLTEFEKFDAVIEPINNILSSIPRIVAEAIYYETKGEYLPPPSPYDDERKEDLRSATNSNLLDCKDDEPIFVNYEHPKLGLIKTYLAELQEFLDSATSEFIERIQSDDSIICSLDNIDFWEKYLF